ncbi:MAG: DUF2862 domain-containing protein [Cyanobacteria bacterium P01_D01_bin.73]
MVIEIGQSVKVKRIWDRVPSDTVESIRRNPVGTVKEFKMVDASGVGVVVEFDGGFATWFFEDEVEPVWA